MNVRKSAEKKLSKAVIDINWYLNAARFYTPNKINIKYQSSDKDQRPEEE